MAAARSEPSSRWARRSAPAIPSSSANAGSDMAGAPDQPLRILHAVRTPVGGIFRHILDVANGQVDRGHDVGIIADTLTGGERGQQALAQIEPRLKLGVHRFPMRREPSITDIVAWRRLRCLIGQLR